MPAAPSTLGTLGTLDTLGTNNKRNEHIFKTDQVAKYFNSSINNVCYALCRDFAGKQLL